ncbi:putative tripartite motif-containing protein 64B [Notamacropus eugenii]|uniref:putative tripartite motif-containing protein 64B n=1 Tax=Notamacropus eugenii TaxID=9315 RepID=UPI003B682C4A
MAMPKEMLQQVQREITCSICRGYFSEPVTIRCGHSFCRACVSSWRVEATSFSCPICRQESQVSEFPIVNEHLAPLTELDKQLCSPLLQNTQGQSQCARHKEDFKLFCEDDQTLLCVRCSQTPEHVTHKLCPVEEAAHDFREQLHHIWSHLAECFEEAKTLAEEKPVVDWYSMITGEFNKLHYFLLQEETRCLERMRQEQGASQDRISQHVQTLGDLMLELQDARYQPDLDLLQDAETLLGRTESVLSQKPKVVIPEVGEHPIPGMIEMLRQFRVDITMDPVPASPCVTVSEDLKSVKAGEAWQGETKHTEDSAYYAVFAKQAFSSGRQYWEVDVSQLPQWMVGIYAPYLRRKRRRNNVDSCDSMFLLQCIKKEEDYCFQIYPGPLKYRVKGPVPRVGVYLEYSSGTLVFYNVLQCSVIYQFQSIDFTAPVRPVFSPGPPLPGAKAGPMTLCPVDSHLCVCCYSSERSSGKNCDPTTRLPDWDFQPSPARG